MASELELSGVIGFNGSVPNGFILHPADKHIIYPLGSTVVVKCLADNSQVFLSKNGHDDVITCLALSSTGKYLATGQRTIQGSPATIIIWDMETFSIHKKLALHKGAVQDLSFSRREQYLATLGGRDDNKIAVWDVASGEAVCGAPASLDTSNLVRWSNTRDDTFITAGNFALRHWSFDAAERRLKPTDVQVGQFKRVFSSISCDAADEFLYAGTKSGDIMKVGADFKLMKDMGPKKRPFSLGVTAVMTTAAGELVVGTGDGTVAVMRQSDLTVLRKTQVLGAVTSLALNAAGDHFFVGTDKSNVYLVSLKTLDFDLRTTCHSAPVTSIAFPRGSSELFATCSASDIRVWHAITRNELLRIQVPNVVCLSVIFSEDGKSILSGWSDGKIRAFKPQSGGLLFVINDAHRDGVSALVASRDCQTLLSGGHDGQVRIWNIGRNVQKLVATMKEHKGKVNSLVLNTENTEVASASDDGSTIVWNLSKYTRSTALAASTQFKAAAFHPDSSQILTGGSDRKLTYWDVADGAALRVVEDSGIHCIAVSPDGDSIVTGGDNKQVKFWNYDRGEVIAVGSGHSGAVLACSFSPDQRMVVTAGAEGGIFIWNTPVNVFGASASQFDNVPLPATLSIRAPSAGKAGPASASPPAASAGTGTRFPAIKNGSASATSKRVGGTLAGSRHPLAAATGQRVSPTSANSASSRASPSASGNIRVSPSASASAFRRS